MTIGIAQTVDFLDPYLSADRRFLEVGCGKGELAAVLKPRVRLTAIDVSEPAVLTALQNGVEAHCIDLLDFEAEPFDIVFFSRSLHHIHSLEKAIDKAFAITKPGGVLIVDDFAAERADEETVAWYFEKRRELTDAGLLSLHFHNIDLTQDPLTWWRQHHFKKHHVSTAAAMREAIAARFEVNCEEFVPYLYRYLIADLLPGVDTSDVAAAIFSDERELCSMEKLRPIGYRLVAAKK